MADRGRMIALDVEASRVARVPDPGTRLTVLGGGPDADLMGCVLPGHGPFREAAEAVLAALAGACGGAAPPTVQDRSFEHWNALPAPLLAIGDPGCNGLLRRLFHLGFLDESDCPAEGFTLKLAVAPFGGTRHVLALCARRPADIRVGGTRLVEALRRSGTECYWDEPWYVVPSRTGLPDPERYSAEHAAPRPDFTGHPVGPINALGHLVATGDPRWGRAFVDTLRPFAEGRVPLSFWRMSAVDFWTDRIVLGWQRIEHLPCFSATDRCLVAGFIAACTRYCHDSLTYQKWSITDADLMVFNHHTFPAVGLFFGASYLARRGRLSEELTGPWIAKALRVVERAVRAGRSYDEGGAGYSWLVAIHVLRIMLARGDCGYAASDRLRRYADLAVMVQNSTLHMVPFGDCGSYDARGGGATALLLQAAAWSGDGGYAWVAAQASPAAVAQDPFCPDLPASPPARHVGLFRLPMDPVVYAWAGRPAFPGYPPPLRVPSVPPELGFDKISLRGGWEPDDDYLLLQGFGGGQHGHPDANAISQYQHRQRLFLVDCDYIRRGPAQHNTVAVIRDGRQEIPPVTARCDQATAFAGGALVRSTLPDDGGCDWERLILWLKDDCLVIADTLTARTAGDYDLRCYWRTLGAATLGADGIVIEQAGEWCQVSETTQSERELTVEPPPLNSTDYPAYAHGDKRPKVLCERRLVRLRVGDRLAFVNLVSPGGDATRRRRDLRCRGDGILCLQGDGPLYEIDATSVRSAGQLLVQTELAGLFAALGQRPPTVEPVARPRRTLPVHASALLPAPVTALAPGPGGWVCGCADGTVASVRGDDGATVILGQAGGAVRAVLAGRLFGESADSVLACGDDSVLLGWDAAGAPRLRVALPRNSHMPAWGRALALADLDGDARLWPIVGTAAWRVHAVTPDGRLRWTFDTAAHAVTALAAHDLNGDGRDEIACATVYFCVPAISADGARLWQDEDYNDFWRAGPHFRTVIVQDVDGDALPEVLSAASDTCVHCISAQGAKKWATSIGDEPAGLAVAHGAIWAASIDGIVHRLDGKGDRLSCCRLDTCLHGLVTLPTGVAVVGAGGMVFFLDRDGRPTATARIPEAAQYLAANGPRLALARGRNLHILESQ